jgi:predicted dehydrogenase
LRHEEEKTMIKVGLIGLGYWGPNLARVLWQAPKCEFTACCDLDPQRLQKVASQYPSVQRFRDAGELLASDVDAVAIATPICTHYELARQALLRGKHVFVEKPLAETSARARELDELARFTQRSALLGTTPAI